MSADPTRRAATLRLAAQYVERKAKGEAVTWSPTVRVMRLDPDGNPEGESLHVGPMIMGHLRGAWDPLPDADDSCPAGTVMSSRRADMDVTFVGADLSALAEALADEAAADPWRDAPGLSDAD